MQKREIFQGKILKETWQLIKLLMNMKSKEPSCFRPILSHLNCYQIVKVISAPCYRCNR